MNAKKASKLKRSESDNATHYKQAHRLGSPENCVVALFICASAAILQRTHLAFLETAGYLVQSVPNHFTVIRSLFDQLRVRKFRDAVAVGLRIEG
jgi:hypothetical protein